MRIENSFEVPLPPEEAWKILLDIERIAPCMPGAELTGVEDDGTYNGKASVKLGPVALSFAGQIKFEAIDNEKREAKAKARGKDSKGRGAADAQIVFRLHPSPAGSQVNVESDLMLTGMVAQYGRASGLIQGVATELIGQFAENLRAKLQSSGASPSETPSFVHAAKPISGFALIWTVLKKAVLRILGRSSGS
jgi:carbon monoxide dehydrogenase subunit G